MESRARKHLAKLREQDKDHPLQSAFCAYLSDPENLDLRISLIGAMHRAGWLQNQVTPYLKGFDAAAPVWARRGLERLLATFQGDPLVLSALVHFPADEVLAAAKDLFPHVAHASRVDQPPVRVSVVRAREWPSQVSETNLAHQCLEVCWTKSGLDIEELHYTKVITSDARSSYLYGPCMFRLSSTAHARTRHWFTQYDDRDLGDLATVEDCVRDLPDWAR